MAGCQTDLMIEYKSTQHRSEGHLTFEKYLEENLSLHLELQKNKNIQGLELVYKLKVK
jgi:hypothetical protein